MQKGWYTAFDREPTDVAPAPAPDRVLQRAARWIWPLLLLAVVALYFGQVFSQ